MLNSEFFSILNLKRIVIEEDDVIFYFVDDDGPWSYREFDEGSPTRRMLESVTDWILAGIYDPQSERNYG